VECNFEKKLGGKCYMLSTNVVLIVKGWMQSMKKKIFEAAINTKPYRQHRG
jgi:hypothetical protein